MNPPVSRRGEGATEATLQTRSRDHSTALRKAISELGPWFHNVHLPDGTPTAPDHPLGDFPAYKWRAIAPFLPERLDGLRALDVGCNAGFYSVELACRGARVTALDVDPHYLRQARFVVDQCGVADRVTIRRGNVYQVAREKTRYDVVWFMGVLYHLRHPLLALDGLSRCTGRLLVFQTLTLPGEARRPTPPDLPFEDRAQLAAPGWPRMAFVQGRLAGDPTNWWVPDPACVDAMLRSSGFTVLARPEPETWLCAPDAGDAEGSVRERELRAALGEPEPGAGA